MLLYYCGRVVTVSTNQLMLWHSNLECRVLGLEWGEPRCCRIHARQNRYVLYQWFLKREITDVRASDAGEPRINSMSLYDVRVRRDTVLRVFSWFIAARSYGRQDFQYWEERPSLRNTSWLEWLHTVLRWWEVCTVSDQVATKVVCTYRRRYGEWVCSCPKGKLLWLVNTLSWHHCPWQRDILRTLGMCALFWLPNVMTWDTSLCISSARAYFLSFPGQPENLAYAETTLNELVALLDNRTDEVRVYPKSKELLTISKVQS